MIVAVLRLKRHLSFSPGEYRYETLTRVPDLTGSYHYINHPQTRALVERKGAIAAPTKFFAGLKLGESYVSFFAAHRGNMWGIKKTDFRCDIVTKIGDI